MKDILFAYDEPAAIVRHGKKRYLVIGDLHIGRELKLAGKGIRIYNASETMAERVLSLMKRYKAKGLVILGDAKDSIIRPDSVEMKIIHSFFKRLSAYEIILVQGNHDAGIGEIKGMHKVREFSIGNVGLIHGNALPSEELMQKGYIIAGHDHPAMMTAPFEQGGSLQKAWAVLKINQREAAKTYKMPGRKTKLILMPAFNDLIIGNDIEGGRGMLNPLVRRGIFSRRTAKVYDIKGGVVATGF